MALRKCVGCGIPLGSDAKFCPQCGMALLEECKCAYCGADLQTGMRFCPECGQAVSEGTTQQVSQVQAPGVPLAAAAAVQASNVNVNKAQNAPQNFVPPQDAGAQSFSVPPMQTSPDEAAPAGGQPMSRSTGAQGGGFGGGTGAAGAAGGLGEWKEKLLSFEGRLNRKPYVLRLLAVSVINSIIMEMVTFILGLIVAVIAESSSELGMLLTVLLYVVTFVLCIPAVVIGSSLAIRRCHDNDWSGWLYLLCFVPLVNIIFGTVLLFKPGTPGPNRFGPDPLR